MKAVRMKANNYLSGLMFVAAWIAFRASVSQRRRKIPHCKRIRGAKL